MCKLSGSVPQWTPDPRHGSRNSEIHPQQLLLEQLQPRGVMIRRKTEKSEDGHSPERDKTNILWQDRERDFLINWNKLKVLFKHETYLLLHLYLLLCLNDLHKIVTKEASKIIYLKAFPSYFQTKLDKYYFPIGWNTMFGLLKHWEDL